MFSSRTAATVSVVILMVILGTPGLAHAQLERAGAWGYGSTYAVDEDLARDLAYVSSGGVVRIVDLQSFEDPQLVADIHSHGAVADLVYDAAHQRLLLACGEGGLEIWDVSVPASPALLSRSEVLYSNVETPVRQVEVMDDIAVVQCSWGYVHTIDVSDPVNPVQVAFNGTMGNPAHDISLGTGGQIHTTGAQYYVRMAIAPSGSINTSGSKHFDFGAGAVFGTPDVAYVGYAGSMFILDLLLPGFPAWSITPVNGITDLEVRDQRAYIINEDGLQIWNVAIYNSPAFLTSVSRQRLYHDIVVDPPYAWIAAEHTGLEVFDVTDPAAPEVAATFTDVYGGTADVEVRGDYAYVADFSEGLVVVDATNLESVELGSYDSPGSAYDVALQGNLAYLADVEGGLRVVDISNPAAPTEVGFLADFDAWRVTPYGNVVYAIEAIANQPFNLHTVDVSNPAAPVDLDVRPLPGSAWGSVRSGDELYVAADSAGVIVFDISVPTAPSQIATYPIPDVTQVDIVGDVLYAASFQIGGVQGGLYTVDVSDPTMPVQLAHLADPGFLPFHVHARGNSAYAAEGDELRLYDVSDPANPVVLETVTLPEFIFNISSVGDMVYVATTQAGVQAYRNTFFVDTTPIFADGFESGDTSAWSSATP